VLANPELCACCGRGLLCLAAAQPSVSTAGVRVCLVCDGAVHRLKPRSSLERALAEAVVGRNLTGRSMPRSSFRYVEKGQRGSVVFGVWQRAPLVTHTHDYWVAVPGQVHAQRLNNLLINPIIVASTRII
jgi:hypothetical protein